MLPLSCFQKSGRATSESTSKKTSLVQSTSQLLQRSPEELVYQDIQGRKYPFNFTTYWTLIHRAQGSQKHVTELADLTVGKHHHIKWTQGHILLSPLKLGLGLLTVLVFCASDVSGVSSGHSRPIKSVLTAPQVWVCCLEQPPRCHLRGLSTLGLGHFHPEQPTLN